MPTPITITPAEIVIGPQAGSSAQDDVNIGNPNIAPGIQITNITGSGGGGGSSARPTAGMIYPRGIC